MNSALIRTEEGKILNLIESLAPMEWRRYQERYPEAWVENKLQRVDCSSYPPYWSFRFKQENRQLINELIHAVDSYLGKVEWIMVGHERENLPGTNWMICPKRSWLARDVALNSGKSVGEYMSEYEPELGPIAYEDIPGLENHLRQIVLSRYNK